MRILLFGDRSHQVTPWRRFADTVIDRAPAAGHEVRFLPTEGDVPELEDESPRFATWTDAQVDAFRGRQRRALDATVESFNPELIHVPHLWIAAHLALETGVPYVVSSWGTELPAYRADPRFHIFAEQAAENAGRIVADNEATRRDLLATFDELEGRVVVFPDVADESFDWLWQLYRGVIAQRRGES